jgi:predicted transposase/invertase (TIGR01784 family)
LDGVFLPPTSDGVVYFCEVQFQPDELLYERMNSEIGIYTYRHRSRFRDWKAIVIYPTRSIEQSNTQTVTELLTSGRIQRIYLDELGVIEELPLGLGLMVLTTLEGENATKNARELIDRSSGSKDIIDLVSTIVVYKFKNLNRDEVEAMLGLKLEETRVYQEAKAEGEIIGKLKGETQLVMRLLKRRLGEIPQRYITKIQKLNIAQLEDLHDAALDFTNITDLESWLSNVD